MKPFLGAIFVLIVFVALMFAVVEPSTMSLRPMTLTTIFFLALMAVVSWFGLMSITR